jgi:hypothetical protein
VIPLFPTFHTLQYLAAEAALGSAGPSAEQYACNASSKYGYYEGEGFVFSPPFIPEPALWGALEWSPGGSTYATAGPRSIVCTRDLGFVESMRVYVKVDAVDRSAPNAMDVSDIGTCWYSEEVLANDEGEGLIIAVYDPTVPSQYLYVQRDTTGTYQSFGLPYVDATEPGEPFEGAFAGLSDDDTYFFDVPIADPFPSLNTAIWFGHGNTSVYPRIIVVGIRINGILFGVDENGEGAAGCDSAGDLHRGYLVAGPAECGAVGDPRNYRRVQAAVRKSYGHLRGWLSVRVLRVFPEL